MGVPGLWDILYELGHSRSLANLTVKEGFEGNKSGRRAYRIGVDASLWYAHAAFAKGGENPDLRLLFFRCLQLAKLAVVPYFVFDGRKRPPIKRGSKMGKAGSHNLTPGLKKLLECFGWTWREAQGEAEAELAYLNKEGIIDAVLTDDGDALIFGATVVIRNQSNNLTGNKSKPALDLNGKASKDHVMIFTADALAQGSLDRASLVLIAMLCGGDYVKEGIKGFGKVTATALARAGFGKQLFDLYALRDDQDYPVFMAQWRSGVNNELRTNSKGFLKHKHASLELPDSFPDLKVLGYYVDPETSRGHPAPQIRDTHSICLPRLAAFCEKHFGEWGYEETIIKRFRTLVWESTLRQLLRRAALQVDEQERGRRLRCRNYDREIRTVLRPAPADAYGLSEAFVTRCVGRREETGISDAFVNRPAPAVTSRLDESKNVLDMKIVGNPRKHASTDGLLEYRVEITPSLFVELTKLGISGERGDPPPPRAEVDPWDVDFGPESSRPKAPKESSKPPAPPDSPMRVWVCSAMLEQVFPNLLDEAAAARAGKKKAPKANQRTQRGNPEHLEEGSSDVETLPAHSSPPPRQARPQPSQSIRPTASQPVTGPSQLPTRRAISPARSPLRPTQPHTHAASALNTNSGLGFKFAFPYTDDPDMMLLEDGLDMPLASSASTRVPRPQIPTASVGPSAPPSSQPLRRASPPRANVSVRRAASQASRPAAPFTSGCSRPAERISDIGLDVAAMFGGGDTDEEEVEPDIIRNASSSTNDRMDHIFDSVFKPRGKGKGKAKAKRVASAPSVSQPPPAKKRRTAQLPSPLLSPEALAQPLPPLPRPRRVSPEPVWTAHRASGITRQTSDTGRSQVLRASSEVIEIDSDSDNEIDIMFPTRLSSPPSTHFDSDDDGIIDLS